MRFIDEVKIRVTAGKGGDGCVSFRREKYIPKGGPDGGDGGRGGSIFLEASEDVQTLLDFRYLDHNAAPNGEKGHGAQCYGRKGEDITLKVPVGTLVSSDDGLVEGDLSENGQRLLVARGGKGGLGNIHFKSSTHQAPRIATPGEPGESRDLHLELKLLSDIGLVGFPNAGKSSLLQRLTAARPKVADYPFTTLTPQLGVIPGDPPLVVADIPGLLEGAHKGVGLGIQFLKHISRAGCFVFLLSFAKERNLHQAMNALLEEVRNFDYRLLNRNRIVAVNKADLLDDPSISEIQRHEWMQEWKDFKATYPDALLVSAKHQDDWMTFKELLKAQCLNAHQRMVS